DRSNAMVVQKNGRVGIGTNSPDAYLHVSGGDAILDRSTSTQGLTRTLIIGGAKATNDTAYAELIFKNYDHDNVIEYTGAKIISYNPTNGSNRGDLRFLTAPDGTQQRERMRIEGQGNVGIDCDPAVKFQVGDSGDGSTAEANAWNTFSDRRYKNDIRSIENANQLISQLNGRRFSWKKSGQNDLGFIAQEVEQVLPEIVHTNENGLKSLDYAKITPVLVEAIKEQWETIDEQQQMINKQSKDIAELKRMIHGLMAERTGDR
ncbi:MAG: tail fiber domain-containing protein, partial [Saprospiraceae bacterium]|nr:tail fiber domain-containing protein [Saprospiraceae bacterium]